MKHQSVLRAATFVAASCLCACASHAPRMSAPTPAAAIAAALADANRPDADKQRDAMRKPAETLAFAGVKPGDSVGELLPGGGYYTRILSKVVGSNGHVYALSPPRAADAPPERPEPAARTKAIAADPAYSNVQVVVAPLTAIAFPSPLDLVWTSQNYHDLHNAAAVDLVAFDRQVFDALKPGGVFLVLDHAAAPGSGARDTSTLHRIDPETVKKEALAAGFVLDGSSDLLHNGDDAHTMKVFDPLIRGNTDQFLLRFRKPAKGR
jgi:predicted methyltransferase